MERTATQNAVASVWEIIEARIQNLLDIALKAGDASERLRNRIVGTPPPAPKEMKDPTAPPKEEGFNSKINRLIEGIEVNVNKIQSNLEELG